MLVVMAFFDNETRNKERYALLYNFILHEINRTL